MRCEEAREQLAEHLLGTLDGVADAGIRRHLRGCAACRRETAALAEGVATFARAAHDVEPPTGLRDRVLTVLDEEWAEAGPPAPARRGRARTRRAAALVALAAAVAWGALMTVRAERFEAAAGKYESFLAALGGEDVRVGQLRTAGTQRLDGSVVIYDSKVGRSWVLVLCRAPGWRGTANVTLVASGSRRIDLDPLEFGAEGEAVTWLVTSADLRAFDRVNVWNEDGLLATASVRPG